MGEPLPDIIWYFNDVMINVSDNSRKYTIVSRLLNITTTESILTVYNVTSSDVGTYTCTASNVVGNDTSNYGAYVRYLYKVVFMNNYLFQAVWLVWIINCLVTN